MAIGSVSHNTAMHASMHSDVREKTAEGSMGARTVSLASDKSSVQDSAEELTFVKDNSKKTKLKDRKEKSKTRDSGDKQKVLQLKSTVKSNDHSDKDLLNRLSLKWSKEKSSEDEMLDDLLEGAGHDPSSAYAELLNLADECEDEAFAQKLNNAANILFERKTAHIQAVLNTIELGGGDFNTSGSLSISYGEITTSNEGPLEIVNSLCEKYGPHRLDEGLDFMFKALATDLSSINPSQDKVALENVGSNLSKAKQIGSALKDCQRLLERFESVHNIDNARKMLPAATIVQRVLESSKKNFVSTVAVREIYKEVKAKDPEQEVLLAQELLSALRDMPIELFDDLDSRSRIIGATRDLIDNLVDKEEQWLAGMEE